MIVKKEYPITMRKDITCSAGKKLMDLAAGLAKEAEVPVKLVIGKEKKNGKWGVYLDEEANENLVAKIVQVNGLDDTDLQALTEIGGYRIQLKGPQDATMEGTLQLLKDESAANQQS